MSPQAILWGFFHFFCYMPKIILESKIINDNYTQYLYDNYDIQNKDVTTTEVPLPSDEDMCALNDGEWNVLLILGKSGSGKSTILNKMFPTKKLEYCWDKAVISQFPTLSEEDACDLLCGVGLSSVPTWLRKPQELSNGEKARLDVCMSIYQNKTSGIASIDEFTSVVNRDVAKSMSFALQRYVRRNGIKVVIASCHYDIIEWLQPDYIFNLEHKDENGEVEMERLVYSDDKDYSAYQTIGDNMTLTDKYPLPK